MSRKPAKRKAAFTLPEVMVAMLLIAMLCLSVFAGLQQVSRAMMTIALRTEAHRLLQAEAERLLNTNYASFTASSAESITSSLKTSFVSEKKKDAPPISHKALPPGNANGRVVFKRQVVAVAATDTSTTLRVDVSWTWQGRPNVISVPLFRTR